MTNEEVLNKAPDKAMDLAAERGSPRTYVAADFLPLEGAVLGNISYPRPSLTELRNRSALKFIGKSILAAATTAITTSRAETPLRRLAAVGISILAWSIAEDQFEDWQFRQWHICYVEAVLAARQSAPISSTSAKESFITALAIVEPFDTI